jgi:hypothetical protein
MTLTHMIMPLMDFHCPLNMAFSTCLLSMLPINTTSYHWVVIIKILFFHYFVIVIHFFITSFSLHCISSYTFIKPYDSLKVKVCLWIEIKNNVYNVLQIQLGCTYGFTFIYLDVLYLKHLINSLIRSNLFKLIMCLSLL